jgi:hypothetical protein
VTCGDERAGDALGEVRPIAPSAVAIELVDVVSRRYREPAVLERKETEVGVALGQLERDHEPHATAGIKAHQIAGTGDHGARVVAQNDTPRNGRADAGARPPLLGAIAPELDELR